MTQRTKITNLDPANLGSLKLSGVTIYDDGVTTYQLDLNTLKDFIVTGDTLQNVYNNSTNPEIITDPTLGSIKIKNGGNDDTDDLIEFQNLSGDTKARITGDGHAHFSNLTVTGFTSTTGETEYLVVQSDGSIKKQTITNSESSPNPYEWYVNGTIGNDTTGNGSASSPFATFSKVHTEMASGDVVYSKGGGTINFAWTKNVVFRSYNTINNFDGDWPYTATDNKGGITFSTSPSCDRMEIIGYSIFGLGNSNSNSVITLRNCAVLTSGTISGKVRAYDSHIKIQFGGNPYYKYEEAVGCEIKFVNLSVSNGFVSIFKQCIFDEEAETNVGADGSAILYNCWVDPVNNFTTTGTLYIR